MRGKGRLRTLTTLAGLFLVFSCLAPLSAAGDGEPETGAVAAFRLHGSHGYEILVLAVSRSGFKHGEMLLSVGRKGAGTIYLAPATVTPEKIEADLGALGEISVSFQPSGHDEVTHSSCGHQPVTYEGGDWVGTIEFHGEEGYTEAVETETKALVRPFLDLLCGGRSFSEASGPGLPGAALSVNSHGRSPKLNLRAVENRPGAELTVRASIEEKRGTVAISRNIDRRFPSGGFRWEEDLSTATLSPPAPFQGSAVFHRNAKPANRWTGNLTLDFPGRSHVAIAGPRFSAGLFHAQFTTERLRSNR